MNTEPHATLTESLRQMADRLHREHHRCPSPPCPFEEEATELRAAADQIELLRSALRLIRDGRCGCGGRFKWSASQFRCEQCGGHAGYGYGGAVEIAKAALGG